MSLSTEEIEQIFDERRFETLREQRRQEELRHAKQQYALGIAIVLFSLLCVGFIVYVLSIFDVVVRW